MTRNYAEKYNAYLDRTVENIITEVSDKPNIMSNIMRTYIRNEIKTFMNSVEILLSQMRIDMVNNTFTNNFNNNFSDNYSNNIIITKQNYNKVISIPSNEVFKNIPIDSDNDVDNDVDNDMIENDMIESDMIESDIENDMKFGEIEFDNEIEVDDNISISSLTEFEFLSEPKKNKNKVEFENEYNDDDAIDNEYIDSEIELYDKQVNEQQNIKNISLDSSLLVQHEDLTPTIKIHKQRTKIPEKMD